jgi:hypothetical protein
MTYCVVPTETDPAVVTELREKFASDPWISVILDNRTQDEGPNSGMLTRRRAVLHWDPPENTIPGARFELRIPPVDMSLAHLPDDAIIARAIERDPAASTELRWRCYARVLIGLTSRLGDRATAHELVPGVMDAMQSALADYPRKTDFSRWLTTFIANTSLDG